jgi:hypothetical protein
MRPSRSAVAVAVAAFSLLLAPLASAGERSGRPSGLPPHQSTAVNAFRVARGEPTGQPPHLSTAVAAYRVAAAAGPTQRRVAPDSSEGKAIRRARLVERQAAVKSEIASLMRHRGTGGVRARWVAVSTGAAAVLAGVAVQSPTLVIAGVGAAVAFVAIVPATLVVTAARIKLAERKLRKIEDQIDDV